MATERSADKVNYAELLARQTSISQREIVDALVAARNDIEELILRRARQGKFNSTEAARRAVYRELTSMYEELNADLDRDTNRGIRRGAKLWHKEAKQIVREAGESSAGMLSWTRFDRKYMREYFELLNPYNAAYIAAVNPAAASARIINGQVERMSSSTVRQLRATVTDVFRQASAQGMTARERQKAIMGRFGALIDDAGLQAWRFIDAGGRAWTPGNYFNMVNRTVSANVQRRSYSDNLTESGRDLVQLVGSIQSNSADACVEWVNRVFSLTGETAGYPVPQDYVDAGGFHPNCLIPGQQVYAPDIKGAVRSHYSGEVFCIKHGSGETLTVTANHMLLTPRGFVAAKDIKKGDNVLRCASAKRVGVNGPNVDGRPALIEEVFVALLESGTMSSFKVPVSAEHLHGDGRFCDSEIDIVAPNGFLAACSDAASGEEVAQNDFVVADSELLPFAGGGPLADILLRAGLATNRLISGSGPSLANANREPSHFENLALRLTTNPDASVYEPTPYNARRNAKLFSDAVVSESSLITLDNVVDVEVKSYVGHVYDLLSKSTLYYANGYLSSNCVHTWLYVSNRTSSGRALINADKDKPFPKVDEPKPKRTTTNKDMGTVRAAQETKREES